MEYEWKFAAPADPDNVAKLYKSLGIHPTLCALLVQRGIPDFDSAKAFFRYSIEDTHDPFLMDGMNQAVQRIEKALRDGEHIVVYGDYDVDGSTSVALFYSFLNSFYENTSFYIPDRYSEGYGVSAQGIDTANERGAGLMITLDCGIRAVNMVDYAAEKGIDVIVCDHHLPGAETPRAFAVLDPKQSHCKYPFKELSGCGIGFKLVQALVQQLNIDFDPLSLVDLVAVSIACDIVPMVGENRILAGLGLVKINDNPRLGLKAILSGRKNEGTLTISDLVFHVGPRINAAGRIDHAHSAVHLLLSSDESEAASWVEKIEAHNTERKSLDESITIEAKKALESQGLVHSNVVYSDGWHKGVIGIVASRLTEVQYRPTVVFTSANGLLTGSVRSVDGVNVHDALEDCSMHIEQFGGHSFAAGLTIKKENLEAFKAAFDKAVEKQTNGLALHPAIDIDIEVDFDSVTPRMFKVLEQMAPFGPGNFPPVFCTRGVLDTGGSKLVGSDLKHVHIRIAQDGIERRGIGFNLAEKFDLLSSKMPLDVVYRLRKNVWRGTESIQLEVLDLRPTENM